MHSIRFIARHQQVAEAAGQIRGQKRTRGDRDAFYAQKAAVTREVFGNENQYSKRALIGRVNDLSREMQTYMTGTKELMPYVDGELACLILKFLVRELGRASVTEERYQIDVREAVGELMQALTVCSLYLEFVWMFDINALLPLFLEAARWCDSVVSICSQRILANSLLEYQASNAVSYFVLSTPFEEIFSLSLSFNEPPGPQLLCFYAHAFAGLLPQSLANKTNASLLVERVFETIECCIGLNSMGMKAEGTTANFAMRACAVLAESGVILKVPQRIALRMARAEEFVKYLPRMSERLERFEPGSYENIQGFIQNSLMQLYNTPTRTAQVEKSTKILLKLQYFLLSLAYDWGELWVLEAFLSAFPHARYWRYEEWKLCILQLCGVPEMEALLLQNVFQGFQVQGSTQIDRDLEAQAERLQGV